MRTRIQHILAPGPGCPGGPGGPGNPTPGSPLGPKKYRYMIHCKLVSVILRLYPYIFFLKNIQNMREPIILSPNSLAQSFRILDFKE